MECPTVPPKYFTFSLSKIWSKFKFFMISDNEVIRTMIFHDLDKAITWIKAHKGVIRDWDSESITGYFLSSDFLVVE